MIYILYSNVKMAFHFEMGKRLNPKVPIWHWPQYKLPNRNMCKSLKG